MRRETCSMCSRRLGAGARGWRLRVERPRHRSVITFLHATCSQACEDALRRTAEQGGAEMLAGWGE